MNMLKNTLCLALVSASFACSSSGDAVDIGTSRTGQKLEDYADSWVGYVEAYKFADGSDKVRINLDASGNGTLEVGDSAALPTATDPDVGYPVGATRTSWELVPGASYPIKTASVESARIQLAVSSLDLWGDWCALQTPYASSTASGYSCQPDHVTTGESGCTAGSPAVAVDCGKLQTCSIASCSCTASGCTAFELSGSNDFTRFDGALADGGESLVGTLALGVAVSLENNITRMNVRLTRQ